MGRRAAYVREAGAGVPLVCIHASASSSRQWRPLMDRLAGRFRTLAVDLYGSWKSPDWPVDRGDLDTAGARFVDYWTGAGAWAGMPNARRSLVATAMRKVKSEWHAAFEEPASLSAFGALDVPTLCLVGSDSPASSRAVARLHAKTLPRVTEIEIERVGHMGPVTHPDRINALIEDHLEQLTSDA